MWRGSLAVRGVAAPFKNVPIIEMLMQGDPEKA
jgi:hypothetical protein